MARMRTGESISSTVIMSSNKSSTSVHDTGNSAYDLLKLSPSILAINTPINTPARDTSGMVNMAWISELAERGLSERIVGTDFTMDDVTATVTYGRLLKPDKALIVNQWLNTISEYETPEDAFVASFITPGVLKDWIHWAKTNAHRWFARLDEFEYRFRTAGLIYHKIPFALRHAVTIPNGPKIEYNVLGRLSAIFESDHSRSRQSFFGPWLQIQQVASDILAEIAEFAQRERNAINILIIKNERLDLMSLKLAKHLSIIETALLWLEDAVAQVAQRHNSDSKEHLLAQYSREGTMFRQWVQTFPEIERGNLLSTAGHKEAYARRLLAIGVERRRFWNMRVP